MRSFLLLFCHLHWISKLLWSMKGTVLTRRTITGYFFPLHQRFGKFNAGEVNSFFSSHPFLHFSPLKDVTICHWKWYQQNWNIWIKSYVLLDNKLRPFARDILRALVQLHGKGVMHRDIKPENILLVQTGKDSYCAKLADFGTSRDTGDAKKVDGCLQDIRQRLENQFLRFCWSHQRSHLHCGECWRCSQCKRSAFLFPWWWLWRWPSLSRIWVLVVQWFGHRRLSAVSFPVLRPSHPWQQQSLSWRGLSHTKLFSRV